MEGAVVLIDALHPDGGVPERRRKEILDSALFEFSTKGYGGARTDAIVGRTNSNKAMIFYYFGSKEGLYIAVLEEVYAGIRRSEAEIDFESLSPQEALKRLIVFTFNYYIENPSFVRMINNENLHEAIFLKRSQTIDKLNTSIISILCDILDRGVEDRVFRAGIDPVDLYGPTRLSDLRNAMLPFVASFSTEVVSATPLKKDVSTLKPVTAAPPEPPEPHGGW